ncbi:MAG: DUF3883 domain-containing protein [Calditrichaceae bacterium]|nr:DUF3883 domain-containing protein [Calditrichaceae bacterium]MBN2708874.1 DUF3883 domain-containing protein [Calditrichaceae bacterium]RQV97600.1 MAG: DUF3883 domain-containing protein [Calditrichota bacterium]
MDNEKFNKLITKRQRWVQSSKENNFDFDSILAGIYNDPSHFIYEILQNAEDANATEISFNLFNDSLEIEHNGKKFDFKDVDGITGIGISTKRDDINSIGKFGVGFKSVFAITQTPVIHSGDFHFEIKDFVIPSLIDNNGITETLIVLPFNHPSRTKDEVFEIVGKKLESIGLKTLLFLKNVKEIKWQTPGKNGHYYKELTEFQNLENVHRVSIISKIEQEENFEEFLVIKKPITIQSHNLNVEIAYRIGTDEAGKEIIENERESKLIVFFPTEKVTYLNFLIQAPYKTTPNRENIPLDDEQNQYLIEETANLVADSIPIIKKLDFLNVSFLEVLPIDQNHTDEIIYSSIFEKVKEKLLSEEALLPTSKEKFTTAQDALLARGKELTELLNETDINVLFNKKNWLDADITYDRTRQLRDYLINELDIKEIDFEDFALSIKKEFIEQKTDDWIIKFYSSLLDQRALWEKDRYRPFLRKKPIIRLFDDSHIEPDDEGNKIQVYLPAETKSKYKTVKDLLTKNELSLKFLTELGISKPDIFAEIREFIVPKYREPDPEIKIEEYLEDFEKLLIAFGKEDSEKKKEMINSLKGLYIIYSTNSVSGEKHFSKPNETYLKAEDLIEYFKGFDHVFFVSDEFNQRLGNAGSVLSEFLLSLGSEDKPRRIKIEPTLTWEEKSELRKRSYYNGLTHEIHTYDYNYEGIENFLENLTEERACILCNLLLRSLKSYPKYSKQDFFKGEYKWKYYNENKENFESKFLKTLKNTPWLVDTNGNFVLPSQISLPQLPDSYTKDDENVEVLINALGFQIDEIKQIEEKTGGKFIPKDEYEEYLKWKKEQSEKETKAETENVGWISEVDPESVEPTVEEIEPETIVTPDLRGQRPFESNNGENYGEPEADDKDKSKDVKSKKQLKDIGKWGERFVYNHLQKQINQDNIEIIWLNENGDAGKGYDFSVVSDGREIEYIEVKSKTDSDPQLFEITGTQWEFARKLYNENEGDKYKIYVVSNAGTENAKIGIIKNPTKLWKEGKLYAHPVHFKL